MPPVKVGVSKRPLGLIAMPDRGARVSVAPGNDRARPSPATGGIPDVKDYSHGIVITCFHDMWHSASSEGR